MTKPQNNRLLKTFKDYPTWQLIFIFILYSFVVLVLLRLNNTGMVSRREAVRSADQEGEAEITKARLMDLQQYVSTHMNTSTGRFFLEGQYKRDSEVIIENAKKAANASPQGNVYQKVSEICDPQFRHYSAPYFQCYMNELAKYPTASYGSTEVKLPNPNMYQVEIISPKWTPDYAGFSVLFWLVFASVIVVRIIGKIILTIILQKIRKSV